ncbi:MAG: ribonuclease domain-containing protein [Clostridia bacterium]|nr:ribonuclease domain-containing protein [Clostridia bacterium]
MLKKILCLLLALLLSVSFLGCSAVDKQTALNIATTLIETAYGDGNKTTGAYDGQQGMPQSGGGGPGSEGVWLAPEQPTTAPQAQGGETTVTYGQSYSTKDEVALYLHLYGELPPNYITKNAAKERGWVASKGNLWKVTDRMSIGGDYFGNYEGLLPKVKGRKYYECDIDYKGGTRGAKRIIYSNDGLVYYTEDHYKTFDLLYDAEGAR